MKNSDRLNAVFARCRAENRGALIVYATCGCPDFASTATLADAAVEAGADILELGVPSADPFADGPVLRTAARTALAGGATFEKVLESAFSIRKRHPETGLVLFSYFSVLREYGLEKLGRGLTENGLDGVLSPDAPGEGAEAALFDSVCRAHGVHRIPLVTPADGLYRTRLAIRNASGFIYYAMVNGPTGVRNTLPPDVFSKLETLKSVACGCPVAAGFGIGSGATAHQLISDADAIVCGSAVMRFLIDDTLPVPVRMEKASALVRELASGVRGKRT